jgi:hypothetical protein
MCSTLWKQLELSGRNIKGTVRSPHTIRPVAELLPSIPTSRNFELDEQMLEVFSLIENKARATRFRHGKGV